jgi:ADP-ribose pyrophosphatase
VLDVIELPLERAMAQIEDGTIRDGKTIIGLQAVYLSGTRSGGGSHR